MKATVFALLLLATSATFAQDTEKQPTSVEDLLSKEGSYEYNLIGNRLIRPFDAALLRRLADHPEEDRKSGWMLNPLILRAGLEKKEEFQYLLKSEKLRKIPRYEAALLAYDFNVNENRKALEALLARLEIEAKAKGSWEHLGGTLQALGTVNEWELSKKALGKYVLSGDGTGGDARYAFWLRRRYYFPNNKLFPTDYQAFRKEMRVIQRQSAEHLLSPERQETKEDK